VLGTHPELVRDVPFDGANPDVDTRADLDRLVEVASATATGKAGAGPADVS
jgi:hypothetical protein